MSKISNSIRYLEEQVERVLAACVDRAEAVRSVLEQARRELAEKQRQSTEQDTHATPSS